MDVTRVCFVCDKLLLSAFGALYEMDIKEPPLRSVCFSSRGNFGSSVFDPMDETVIEITICDECLINRKDKVIAYKVQNTRSYQKVDNAL